MRGWGGTAAFAGFTLGCTLIARPPLRALWRGLQPIGGLIALTVVADALLAAGPAHGSWLHAHLRGLEVGLAGGVHLWLLAWQSTVATVTTDSADLVAAVERLLAPFGRLGLPVGELALMTGIALRFIPTLVEEADRIIRAQAARGAMVGGGVRARWRLLVASFVPLLVSSFRRADALATAMEVRGYTGSGRTRWRASRWGTRDLVAATMVAALVVCTAFTVFPGR